MEKVKAYLDELIERYPVLEVCREDIWKAFETIAESYEKKGKLLVAGNGGSAADAEHIVGELMKGFVKPRKLTGEIVEQLQAVDIASGCVEDGIANGMGQELVEKLQGALPAIALVDHVALSTAYLNDVDPLLGFAQQVNGYGQVGDSFLAISTSGNSKNILYACTIAKAKGLKVIGLTGGNGGKMKDLCDVTIVVPEPVTFKIQELHLPIYHALCLMLEERFFS